MRSKGTTAPYKVIMDAGGNRYRFYCESSGMAVCTTPCVHAETPEKELLLAWENEGRRHFSCCRKCGKWVSDVMYNVETMECVDCSPWEDSPLFCAKCGVRIPSCSKFCRNCGAKLTYSGGNTP